MTMIATFELKTAAAEQLIPSYFSKLLQSPDKHVSSEVLVVASLSISSTISTGHSQQVDIADAAATKGCAIDHCLADRHDCYAPFTFVYAPDVRLKRKW